MSESGMNVTNDNPLCVYHPPVYSAVRLFLTVGIGPLCAIFGLCANTIIVYIFLGRMQCMRSHLFYLCILAFFDMTVEMCYMAVFSVQMIAEHWQIEWMWWLWHQYVIPLAAIGQTSITSAAFMMVAASFERYLVITHWAMNELVAIQRCSIVFVVLLVACVAKGPVYSELTVRKFECLSAFEAYKLDQSDVVRANESYRVFVMFYMRHGVTVFLPFFLLVYLNVSTVVSLKRHLQFRGALMRIVLTRASVERQEDKIRAATRMLVCSVAAYVIANTFNIVLTAWEHVDRASLETLQPFYAISADVISYLTLMCGVIRLPIYYACNSAVRVECERLFKCRWKRKHSPLSTQPPEENHESDDLEMGFVVPPTPMRLRAPRAFGSIHSSMIGGLERIRSPTPTIVIVTPRSCNGDVTLRKWDI